MSVMRKAFKLIGFQIEVLLFSNTSTLGLTTLRNIATIQNHTLHAANGFVSHDQNCDKMKTKTYKPHEFISHEKIVIKLKTKTYKTHEFISHENIVIKLKTKTHKTWICIP
jgi:hypothetical protein